MQNKEFNTNKDDNEGGKQAAIDHLISSVNEDNREGDDLPEDPSEENSGFKIGQKVKANGKPGTIKKFGGDCVYVDHGDGKSSEYDISEISESLGQK